MIEMGPLKVTPVPIEQLFVSEGNVRKLQTEAEKLIPSILKDGIIKPLDVYQVEERFAIIDGQRRYLAVKKILEDHPEQKDRFGEISCVVHDDIRDENQAMEFSFKDTLHKKDAHPLDKARAIRKLIELHGRLQKVSEETGIPISTLSQLDSLNDLDPQVQEMMRNFHSGKGFLSKAIELSKLPNEKQAEMAKKILTKDVTGGLARSLIRAEKTGKSSPLKESKVPIMIGLTPAACSALESAASVKGLRKEDYVESLVVDEIRKLGYLRHDDEHTEEMSH